MSARRASYRRAAYHAAATSSFWLLCARLIAEWRAAVSVTAVQCMQESSLCLRTVEREVTLASLLLELGFEPG